MTTEAQRRAIIQRLIIAGARWGYQLARRGEPFHRPVIAWSADGQATITTPPTAAIPCSVCSTARERIPVDVTQANDPEPRAELIGLADCPNQVTDPRHWR